MEITGDEIHKMQIIAKHMNRNNFDASEMLNILNESIYIEEVQEILRLLEEACHCILINEKLHCPEAFLKPSKWRKGD